MGRLEGLDAQRGIAAIIVAALHATMLDLGRATFAGYLAVDYFFLLSGFVLAGVFEPKFPKMGVLKFFVIRFKRLWPLITVGSVLGSLFDYFHGWPAWYVGLRFIAATALLPFIDGVFRANPPAWSITFELVVNVLHILIFRHLSVRALLSIAAVSAAVLIGFAPDMDVGQGDRLWLGLPRAVMGYCAGIALYRVWGTKPFGHPSVALLGVPVIIAVGSVLPDRLQILALIPAPLVLLSGLSLKGKWLEHLGAISFPLYAIHFPVMCVLTVIGLPWPLTLAGAVAAAVIALRLIDLPVLRQRKVSLGTG